MTNIAPHLNDIHRLNLFFLSTIQKTCIEDALRASSLFGLTTAEIEVIKGLSVEAVHALASSLNESIAILRFSAHDIASLASAPEPMQTLFAAVHVPSFHRDRLAA